MVRQFLLDEQDPAKRSLFFRDAEGWREDFRDHSYFLASAPSGSYFFNSDKNYSEQPREVLHENVATNAWFYNTMRDDAPLSNINVDTSAVLRTTKVWFNFVVLDGKRRIGVAGTGLDLSAFLQDFVSNEERGVTAMIVNGEGSIQAHPDKNLIALNSGSGGGGSGHTLFGLLGTDAQREAVRQAMRVSQEQPGDVQLIPVTTAGKRELLALTYMPDLKWYVVNLVDLGTAKVIDGSLLTPLVAALGVLLALMLGGFAYAVERLVLRPIGQLKRTAQAMAAGRYDVQLPPARGDEIGELSNAFGVMAEKVRNHTAELEDRVRQRTQALELANRDMAAAHKLSLIHI